MRVFEDGEVTFDEPAYFEIVSRFGDLYVSYRQRFVLMKDGMSYVPKYGGKDLPLTNKIISAHLNHRYAICVYAGAHSSKFICFDVDDGNRDTVKKIIDALDTIGFDRNKIYVSTSGGKGYHVELFFDGLMYTDRLRILYDYVCDAMELDKAKVEFRPTAGQSIKLPLSIHRKTGNICWYLDRDTFDPIETQAYVMEIERFAVEEATELIKAVRPVPVARPHYERGGDRTQEISEEEHGEICGDRYPDLRRQGERHNLMVQIGVHNRYRGLSPAACKDELTHWYRRQNQEFIGESERSVMTDIDEIVAWAYSDKFQVSKKSGEIVFTPEEFRILAAQPVQARRKIMFYVLLCMKKYGHTTAGTAAMAELLGISRQGTIKALAALQADRWIIAKRNRCVSKPEGVIRLPNTYFLCDGAVGWSKNYYFADIPGGDRRRELLARGLKPKTERVQLPFEMAMDKETIKAAYVQVMTAAFDKHDLQEIMTKKEFEELEDWKHERVQEDVGSDDR